MKPASDNFLHILNNNIRYLPMKNTITTLYKYIRSWHGLTHNCIITYPNGAYQPIIGYCISCFTTNRYKYLQTTLEAGASSATRVDTVDNFTSIERARCDETAVVLLEIIASME